MFFYNLIYKKIIKKIKDRKQKSTTNLNKNKLILMIKIIKNHPYLFKKVKTT